MGNPGRFKEDVSYLTLVKDIDINLFFFIRLSFLYKNYDMVNKADVHKHINSVFIILHSFLYVVRRLWNLWQTF